MGWWLITKQRPIWKKAPPGLQRPSRTDYPIPWVLYSPNPSVPHLGPDLESVPKLVQGNHPIIKKGLCCWERFLCKFGRICATGNAFVRLIVGRNSILNFPTKIWTGLCRALLWGDDSSHSQGQSGKRLLLASRGHAGWILAYHGSPMTPTCLSPPLDRTSEAPFPRLVGTIRLLKKD